MPSPIPGLTRTTTLRPPAARAFASAKPGRCRWTLWSSRRRDSTPKRLYGVGMAIYRMQCSWQVGSAFPRDRMVIDPVFRDSGVGTDPEGLVEDLATALSAWSASTNELVVKAYNLEDPIPRLPKATAIRNEGAIGEAGLPRELALCLSFYSGVNQPRRRGRLYVPLVMIAGFGSMPARPSSALMNKVLSLGPIFADLGGADVDWSVYSTRDSTARAVSNYWVDDEWDVVRKRGLRPTTRVAATASE